MASREIERGGVLAHQHGGLLQALPGRLTGEALLQGGGPHPLVGQEAIDPLGLSPAARGLRDGIARPLRERFQDAGQAGRESFVRQHRSRRHPRRPECVRVHRASPPRYQSLLSAAPFLLSTTCPLGHSRSARKLWVMISTYTRWSLQVAASPCWEMVFPDVISASLSQDAWAMIPAGRWVRMPVSSPTSS